MPCYSYFSKLDTLKFRAKFGQYVGRENVIAGTDCGFSQSWSAIRVHPQVQWAKLQTLAAGARLATRELWRK
jgi:5-methyltetrahydropteroyltriglutamate--homocysteine methyltransferase